MPDGHVDPDRIDDFVHTRAALDEAMRLAVKRLDMAAAKKVIHKNQAARRKSRLMKKINAVTAAATSTD